MIKACFGSTVNSSPSWICQTCTTNLKPNGIVSNQLISNSWRAWITKNRIGWKILWWRIKGWLSCISLTSIFKFNSQIWRSWGLKLLVWRGSSLRHIITWEMSSFLWWVGRILPLWASSETAWNSTSINFSGRGCQIWTSQESKLEVLCAEKRSSCTFSVAHTIASKWSSSTTTAPLGNSSKLISQFNWLSKEAWRCYRCGFITMSWSISTLIVFLFLEVASRMYIPSAQ